MTVKFRTVMCTLISACLGVSCFALSSLMRQGVANAVNICITTIVPSLFLFTAVATFAVKSDFTEILGRILHPLSSKLFRLSGEQLAVFVISLFAGYPVGASLVNELYREEKVDLATARRMVNFCVCAGPAFILIAIGEVSLGHKPDGYRLLLAHTVSAIVLALLNGLTARKPVETHNQNHIEKAKPTPISISTAFCESATAAARSMLSICTFVIVFGALGNALTILESTLTPFVVNRLRALIEVTVGVELFGRGRLSLIAFFIGFGGLSVHFQILNVAKSLKINYFSFLLHRIAHGAISAGITALLELIFPRYVDVLSSSSPKASLNGSPLSVFALLLMGAVLIFYSKPDYRQKG